MNIELIKILSALVFLFVALTVISVLVYTKRITTKQYVGLLMGMLAIMGVLLGVAIDWKSGKAVPVGQPVAGERATYAYGLKMKRVVWVHRYLSNYGFRGSIEYEAENASTTQIVDLPPDKAGWFGWIENIKRTPKATGASGGFYSVQDEFFSQQQIWRKELDGRNKKVTQLFWQYRLEPPLAPGKQISYATEFETANTEHDAYLEAGSFAGMSTPYPATTLRCELYAPDGYRFENRGFIVRDRAGNQIDYRALGPAFEDRGKKITWTVDDPIPNVQYFIKVLLVKNN